MGFQGNLAVNLDTDQSVILANTSVPILSISHGALHRQVSRFLTSFAGETAYAVKANDNPCVLRVLYKSGICVFDVASLHEIKLVRETCPGASIHYHNPVKSTEEITATLYQFSCTRFAVDHISELEKINHLVADPSKIEIAIRFRSEQAGDAVQSFQSKFGANLHDAAQLLKLAKSYGYTVGLTSHPGSQTLSPEPYVAHIHDAARIEILSGVSLNFLNVGGGFPANYADLPCPALESYFDAIHQAASKFFTNVPKLECEPGRALVAVAGELKTSIKAVRSDSHELFLNDGIYGGLMEVSQFPELKPYCLLEAKKSGKLIEWTAYGPTCDPIDVLPHKLLLPENISEGDRIIFHGVGAYCTATSTRFNGYGEIETVMVDDR